MLRSQKKNRSGFTIIEVLIVLAIAGLIMVAVFTAVPALQRSGNNTTRRADASKALGAVGEFVANNNGKVPTTANLVALTTAANLSSGTTLNATIPTTVAGIVAPSADELEIVTGVVCNSAATLTTAAAPTAANYQALVTAGSTRAYVVVYSVQAAGGNYTTQCTGS